MSKKEKKQRTLRQIILAALGKAWLFWPPRLAVKKRCKDPNKSGWWICEKCHQSREKLDVDHKIPCIRPADGFTTWDKYISAIFVETPEQLQGLCVDCHKEKSKQENIERRMRKKKAISDGNGFLPLCGHDDPSWCTDTCHRGKVVE